MSTVDYDAEAVKIESEWLEGHEPLIAHVAAALRRAHAAGLREAASLCRTADQLTIEDRAEEVERS